MFKWFNSNLFNQILTGAIIAESAMAVVLLELGCTPAAADTALVCTASTLPVWMPAWLLPWLIGAASVQGAVKWGIKMFEGDTWFSAFFKPTAVISTSGAPGTVTQKQVDTGRRK